MTEFHGSGDAGESAAIFHLSTQDAVPRSQSFACDAGEAGQAIRHVTTPGRAPDPRISFYSQVCSVNPRPIAVEPTLADDADVLGLLQPGPDSSSRKRGRASQASVGQTPKQLVPGSLTKSGSDVGTVETDHMSSPSVVVSQLSKLRLPRKRDDASDVGQVSVGAHDADASIAHPSRRKAGASKAREGAASIATLPCSQSLGVAEARQAIGKQDTSSTLPAAQPLQLAREGECRVGHSGFDNCVGNADPALIEEIRLQWKMRTLWLRAEIALTLQAKAFCRRLAVGGDKKEADVIYKAALGQGEHPMSAIAMAAMLPLLDARDGIERKGTEIEKALIKLAKRLPVAPFVIATHGASLKGLAAIVGEAGDLGLYSNPGKLWKRMGLAPHQGKAYSTWRRDGGLSAADWTEAGYAPKRRSAMFVIGGSLIGGMGRGKRPMVGQDLVETDWSPLERLFVERLRHEAARDPAMGLPPTEAGKESYTKHAAARAQRYVEKRFLRDLWRAWRGEAARVAVSHEGFVPPLPQFAEAAE